MSDKKHNRPAPPPGGDRPLRRPAAKSGAPGKFQGKSAGTYPGQSPGKTAPKTFGASNAPPRGKALAKSGDGETRPGKAGFGRSARPPVEKIRETAQGQEKAFAGDRIAKVMARAGVCSRRDAEIWISEGRVAVNGRVLSGPAVNVSENDRIEIDGKPMQARERTRMFLFHKPVGLVTSARDPEGRETVFAYLDAQRPDLPRVVSVGRLDINTEGLLLLTNDGGLARTLELPATGWTRRYRVRAHGAIDQARLDALKKGVVVEGVVYAPIDAQLERVQGANAWIAMSLTEGKNREIKRVLAHLGLEVTRLIRVSYGPFQLGDLPEGAVEEVRLKVLREQLGKNLAELAGVDFSAPARELTAAEREEMRQRVEKRPRKHVSVLRKQRDEQAATGPRARIERGATADRKGRAVVVERVTPTRPRAAEEAPATRNARRFESMRDGGRPPRRERPATADEMRETRPPRRPRADAPTDIRRDERRPRTQGAAPAGARDRGRPAYDQRRSPQGDNRREAAGQERRWQGSDRQRSDRQQYERPARAARAPDRQHERTDGWREERRDNAAPRGERRNAENFQPREPRRDDAGSRWPKMTGAQGADRGPGHRGDYSGQKRERPAAGPNRSGGKFTARPGDKPGAGRGKGSGKGTGKGPGGGPGKGPRGDRPPRRPRGS